MFNINTTKSFLYSFRVYFLGLFISCFLAACLAVPQSTKQDIYLPKPLQQVQLEMSMATLLTLRPNAYIVHSLQETPRHIYTEDLETNDINSVYYLFDKSDSKKLIEINILYKSEEIAKKSIINYFGEQKNDKQNQWYKTLKDGSLIQATWLNKKVFIFIDNVNNNSSHKQQIEK